MTDDFVDDLPIKDSCLCFLNEAEREQLFGLIDEFAEVMKLHPTPSSLPTGMDSDPTSNTPRPEIFTRKAARQLEQGKRTFEWYAAQVDFFRDLAIPAEKLKIFLTAMNEKYDEKNWQLRTQSGPEVRRLMDHYYEEAEYLAEKDFLGQAAAIERQMQGHQNTNELFNHEFVPVAKNLLERHHGGIELPEETKSYLGVNAQLYNLDQTISGLLANVLQEDDEQIRDAIAGLMPLREDYARAASGQNVELRF